MDLVDKLLQDGTLDYPLEDAAFLRTLPPEAAWLVYQDVAFIGCDHQHDWKGPDSCEGQPHGKLLDLLLNDTFGYCSADAEDVKSEQCAAVAAIYRQYGDIGLVCWAAKKRGMDQVIEYTEDPEYQKTWTALYGDLKLAPNRCNQAVPRWSNEKLNLKPWNPSELKTSGE